MVESVQAEDREVEKQPRTAVVMETQKGNEEGAVKEGSGESEGHAAPEEERLTSQYKEEEKRASTAVTNAPELIDCNDEETKVHQLVEPEEWKNEHREKC